MSLFPKVLWFQEKCSHDRQRCIHGDEIIAVGFKRGVCLDCGKFQDELPAICFQTGKKHGDDV